MRLTRQSSIRSLLAASMLTALAAVMPGGGAMLLGTSQAFADEEPPPPPPLPDDEITATPDDATPSEGSTEGDKDAAPPTGDGAEFSPLQPGEAVVTRFSHTVAEPDAEGQPVTLIDVEGISASILDIRRPGEPPSGQHWIDEPQRLMITAGEVGQVFGVALRPREDSKSPDIFLSATSAFGLHRTGKAPGNTEWMPGMWGPDSGPGSIFRVSDETGYLAEKFTDVKLDGRANTGAALGNIAYDQWHSRLVVSDLETGMIHVLSATTGEDFGHFDHGTAGRTSFVDAATGQSMSLPPVAFDPKSAADIEECAGDFATTPECWNIADFRRRVWGLNVRKDASGEVRLYYSVWSSDAFGNTAWAQAGDERRNSVWSVAITGDGMFDEATVRREFVMPGFWPTTPDMGDKAGRSNAVSDIAFPDCGPQDVMLVSERGGMRNLGLDKVEAFSRPYESRVLRYERGTDGIWRAKGRYDVGFHDRSKDGEPIVFASAAGGAAFGYGVTEDGLIDTSKPSESVWMTGDGLCSPAGPCTSLATGEHDDDSEVHGLQGTPADALVAVEPDSKPDTAALDRSYMIDTDINIGTDGAPIAEERTRNDATRIGDVAIYQVCGGGPLTEDAGDELPPGQPPEDWPVHNLKMSHEKWASSGHRVQRSWHRREGSWHAVDRSWHWKRQSYHSRNESWHWRGVSAHGRDRSWHKKGLSSHDKRYSWHSRDRSWHLRSRSFHNKERSWDNGHAKGKSYHVKTRSWSGDHKKGQSYHVKPRSWTGEHVRSRSYHNKNRSWGDNNPNHVKARSYHKRDKTWSDGRPDHNKDRSRNDDGGGGKHVKGRSQHDKGKTWGGDDRPGHVKARSDADNKPKHTKQKSAADDRPKHSKQKSAADDRPKHSKQKSAADDRPKHSKQKSAADDRPKHSKQKSKADDKPKHTKQKSKADDKPKHGKDRNDSKKKLKHKKKTSETVPA